jgi:hypothetical protein
VNGIRWYRLAEGSLGVASADLALAERFEEIYGDCAAEGPGEGPRVVCRVTGSTDGTIIVRFDDPEPLDDARFIEAVFPDRGYAPAPHPHGGVALPLPGSSHVVRLHDGTLTAPRGSAWQPLAANLAVSRLLRLQRSLMFFHAASVRVGERGLMACGPKRSGKTTLALSLLARGHTLLGDEVAALSLADRALLPFHRSIATREGPSSAAADSLLSDAGGVKELFPDGELRTRVAVRRLGGNEPPARTPLTTLLLLRSIVPVTRIQRVPARPELLGALTPLAASLWDRPAGSVGFRLLGILSAIRVFEVDAGPPDEVATMIEHLMENE